MKGPEGPGRKGNQPQNESEADFHSREVSGFWWCGNPQLFEASEQTTEILRWYFRNLRTSSFKKLSSH